MVTAKAMLMMVEVVVVVTAVDFPLPYSPREKIWSSFLLQNDDGFLIPSSFYNQGRNMKSFPF